MPNQNARILAQMPKFTLWWGRNLTVGDNLQICISIRFWFPIIGTKNFNPPSASKRTIGNYPLRSKPELDVTVDHIHDMQYKM